MTEQDKINIRKVVVGDFQANCYIVWHKEKTAIVIDPGAESAAIQDVLKQETLSVCAFVLTHGHVDHISGLARMKKQWDVPVGMHPSEEEFAFSDMNQMFPYYSVPDKRVPIVRKYKNGQNWSDGGLEYTIFHTPGHSPGSVCVHFSAHKVLFTGDTLFQGSIGRTDFPGSDSKRMSESLRKLAEIDEKTVVYPGHGASTTIGDEMRTNPFFGFARSPAKR